MPIAQGRIEAISVKELNAPDQYDNTHRLGVLLEGNDKWFSFGSNKGGTYVNKGVEELNKGDEIEFSFNVNGDFQNVKKASVEVTKKAPVTESTAPIKQIYISGSPNPAEVGQCINLAVQLGLADSYEALLDTDTMVNAIYLYKETKEQFTKNWGKKKQEKTSDTNSDNDIPF